MQEYAPVDDLATAKAGELVAKADCLSNWIDVQVEKSSMFYILGPLDSEELKKNDQAAQEANEAASQAVLSQAQQNPASALNSSAPDLTREQIAEIEVENATVHYGRVEADTIALSALHQDVRDLINKMTASEKLSEACNARDRQGYQKTFE